MCSIWHRRRGVQARDVDRILWRHWLVIYVPEQVEHDTAFLMIGAGDNSYHPHYEVEMKPPAEGWIAFLVESIFPDPVREGHKLTFTTEVSVAPDTLPYEKNKRSDT